MIFESRLISATNTDVLSVGRLNSIPYNGQLTLRFLADLGDVTNNYSLTLQKPNGDVPVDGQLVNVGSAGTDGNMKDDEVMQFTFSATQGGHFVVSLTENGTATCMFQAILRP
jgi:hypothetical protein